MAHPLAGKRARIVEVRDNPEHGDIGKSFNIMRIEIRENMQENTRIYIDRDTVSEHIYCAYMFPDEVEINMDNECMFANTEVETPRGWVLGTTLLDD